MELGTSWTRGKNGEFDLCSSTSAVMALSFSDPCFALCLDLRGQYDDGRLLRIARPSDRSHPIFWTPDLRRLLHMHYPQSLFYFWSRHLLTLPFNTLAFRLKISLPPLLPAWGQSKLLEFTDGDERWLWVTPTRSGAINCGGVRLQGRNVSLSVVLRCDCSLGTCATERRQSGARTLLIG